MTSPATSSVTGSVTQSLDAALGDFSPTDIAGLVLWLDAADTSSLWQDSGKTIQVAAADDPVGCWADKSGNGNDWTQTTDANRPTYKENFNTTYPALTFPSDLVALNGSMSESAGDWTIFAVATESDSNRYIFDFLTGRFILGANSLNFGWYDGAWQTGGNLTNGTPYVLIAKLNNGANGEVLANGASWVTGAYNQVALGGTQRLGNRYADTLADFNWTGHIASLLIYDGNLNAADIASVETYLKNRYGIGY